MDFFIGSVVFIAVCGVVGALAGRALGLVINALR